MKKSILILLIIFLSACSSAKQISKLYGKCNKDYLACIQIQINSDNTFEYFVFYDVGGGNVLSGKWEKGIGDTLILNTIEQPKILNTKYVTKLIGKNNDSIKVSLKGYEYSYSYANIRINDTKFKVANYDGVCYFDKTEIKTITYNYLGEEETIFIEGNNYNEIEILAKDFNSGVMPLMTNEPILFKNNEVILYPNNSNRRIAIKRSRLKRKQWK